jgi:hypothetical protein
MSLLIHEQNSTGLKRENFERISVLREENLKFVRGKKNQGIDK